MARALLIAEKPDLMRKVKSVYERLGHKDTIDFMAFHGHSMVLCSPDEYTDDWKVWKKETLPMIPDKMKYKPNPTDTKTFFDIKKKIQSGDYDYLINCCDPDREGQLIFHSVYTSLNCKLPVKRMWHLDLTDEELKKNLDNLRDDLNDPMLSNMIKASFLRAYSDWFIGMNFTRAFTLNCGKKTNIGRVMIPTLNILVEREKELTNFVPKDFFEVEGEFGSLYKSIYFDHNNENETRFFDKKKAEDFIKNLGKEGTIESVEKKKETKYAPPLHSLAEIQREASKTYGFTLEETLNLVQSLYEKQILSYPRTDCSYLSSGEAKKFPSMLNAIKDIPEVSDYVKDILRDSKLINDTMENKKYVDDKKVSAHYAIIPTGKPFNFSCLSDKEQKIILLVSKRLVSIFLPPVVSNKTTIVTDVNGNKFKTTGSVLIDKGYSVIYGRSFSDNILPDVKKGEKYPLTKANLIKKTTTPPSRYTDDTLLAAMENAGKFVEDEEMKAILKEKKGIGTPATRANILEKLISLKMVERKKKNLIATEYGINVINSLGGHKITSPEMTAEWEDKLMKVEKGELTYKAYYSELLEYLKVETDNILKLRTTIPVENSKGKNNLETIGKCPCCGKEVKEGPKFFLCEGYPNSCKFIIGKEILGAKITKTEAKKVLSGKPTKVFDFHNDKTGKNFSCGLKIDGNKVGFDFSNSNKK